MTGGNPASVCTWARIENVKEGGMANHCCRQGRLRGGSQSRLWREGRGEREGGREGYPTLHFLVLRLQQLLG